MIKVIKYILEILIPTIKIFYLSLVIDNIILQ